MKNTLKNIALTLTAAIAFSSCAKENAEVAQNDIKLVPIQFSVSSQDNSVKSIIDNDRKVKWEDGDKIGILDPTSNTVVNSAFAINIGDNTVDAQIPEGATAFYGLYPFDANASISGNTITTSIKSQQFAVAGNLPKEANLAIGYTTVENKNMLFKNIGSLVSFTLDYEDIVSVTLSGNNNEKLAGKVSINYPANGEPVLTFANEAVGALTLKKEDGTPFAKSQKYYMVVGPQTFTGRIKLTLVNSKGKVAVKNSSNSLALTRNGNVNLGLIDNLTFDKGLFDAYNNGAAIKIGGEEYSKDKNGEATLLNSSDASDLYAKISGKKGVFFLDGSGEFTNSNTIILSKELVLIANKTDERPKYKPTTKGWSIRNGSIALAYIDIDMSGFTPNYLMNNHSGTNEDFVGIVFDNCKITSLKKSLLLASNNTKAGVSKISVTNSSIQFSATNIPLFNAKDCTEMYKYKEIVFENNVFYAASAQNVQLLNYNNAIAQNGTDWDVQISLKNNIFYNLTSANGLIRQYQAKKLDIGGNIYQVMNGGTGASKSYYLFSSAQDKNLIHNSGDKLYLASTSLSWIYSGTGSGQANGIANALSNEAADMFDGTFNTTDGTYTLNASYSAFGPQNK